MEEIHIQDGTLVSYTGREEILAVPEGVHTIGEGALKGCASLKKVILPQSLRRILGGAFKGCRKLENVEIPPGLCEIGAYAFHRCHALRTIFLPPAVEALGDCAFLYCDSLEEARIPGVRYLGNQSFANDVTLKRITLSHALEEDCICDVFTGCGLLTEFTFEDGSRFVIPNVVEAVAGKLQLPQLVQRIAADILRMMELDGRTIVQFSTNLKHVEIPEGIEILGKSSFFDKRGIHSVKLPKSLKEIESRAFRNCIGLETVILNREDLLIHEDAFKNCTALKMILMPDGVRYELKGIARDYGSEIPETVKTIHRQVLGNFRISGTVLLKYLGAESRVVVPEGITVIAEEAFAGNETIDRVILPESLLEIGSGAFRDCLLLQNISFPQNLKRIGREAFENCVKLLRVTLPRKITRLEPSVFKRCRALKEIDLGGSLARIEEQAFFQCRSLEKVSFPESLVSIGELAFYRCVSLKNVILSANVADMGSLAFAESGVETVQVGGDCRNYGTGIFSDCTGLKKLALEEGVSHIPDKLAYGCTALGRIVLPDSLKSVGESVWEKTPFLDGMNPAGQTGEIFWDGRNLEGEIWLSEDVRILAGGAFYGNPNLTAIHLPSSIQWVGPRAFGACAGLRRVYWHSPVDRLEKAVFAGCLELVSVEDAEGKPVAWKSVGDKAFYHCGRLREICLKQAESIGSMAFGGCSDLRWDLVSADLPDVLYQIGERAFEDTALIKQSGDTLKALGSIVISGTGCSGVISLPEGITGIAPFAFSGNDAVTKVIFPKSLSWIGEGAFWGCHGLREVVSPEKIFKIGARAFEKCISLFKINIRVKELGTAAFAYCTSLTEAVLSGVSVLSGRLFEGCASLRICACENAEKVQEHCFGGCIGLEEFDLSHICEIGEYAFENCARFRKAEFAEDVRIMPHAFEDCGRLEEICLGGRQSGFSLQEYAFSGCTFLRRVYYEGKKWEFGAYEDILSERIPEIVRLIFHSALSCFIVDQESILRGYRGAGSVIKIPWGIRRIAAEVFRDSMMLEEITIPESVEHIGARAFHGTAWMDRQRRKSPFVAFNHMLLDGSCCVGEVVVPEEIKLVCGWAFANGMGIERIRFMSERTRVEEYAFRNCIYLEEIILPDQTVFRITGIADRERALLSPSLMEANTKESCELPERELPSLAAQAVVDSMNCFKTDEKNVLVECTGNISRLRLPEGITAIGEGVFQDGNLLTEVTVSSSIVSVGNRAFSGCKWLREIRQAQNVEEIGKMAFFNCGALERIDGLEKLRRLGAGAFENCTSLQEILIPEGVEEIPEKAFYRCHSLKRVLLPSTIKRIGREAFAFCRGLSLIQVGGKIMKNAMEDVDSTEDIPEGAAKDAPENLIKDIAIEERAFVGCPIKILNGEIAKGLKCL